VSNKGVKFDKVLKRNRGAIQDNDISQKKSKRGVSNVSPKKGEVLERGQHGNNLLRYPFPLRLTSLGQIERALTR